MGAVDQEGIWRHYDAMVLAFSVVCLVGFSLPPRGSLIKGGLDVENFLLPTESLLIPNEKMERNPRAVWQRVHLRDHRQHQRRRVLRIMTNNVGGGNKTARGFDFLAGIEITIETGEIATGDFQA